MANGPANVFKDLNTIVWVSDVLVDLVILVSNWILRFDFVLNSVPLRCELIDSAASLVVAFKGIAIDETCRFVNANSATSFAAQTISTVLCRHKLLRK